MIRPLLSGAALALVLALAPAVSADDLAKQQWDEFHDFQLEAMGEEQLGEINAWPIDTAWQQIELGLPSEDELTPQQKSEKQQLESGEIVYVVEIPPEQRVPGGPTHRTVTSPAPFGGTDSMIGALAGDTGMGSQIQSTLVDNIGSASFMQDSLGGGMQGGGLGGMLAGGLIGPVQ